MNHVPETIVVVGSLNIDLAYQVERFPNPGETVNGHSLERHAGGKGLNQAVAAARLGARVHMVGAVGDDANGAWLRDVLSAAEIDATHIATASGPAGTALIEVDDNGENRIVVIPGANGMVTPDDVTTALNAIADIGILLVQGELDWQATAAAIRIAHERGATIIVNPAPAHRLDAELLRMIDVIIANQHETQILTGMETDSSVDATEAALWLTDAGCGTVIVTRGDKGCVWSSDGNTGSVPIFRVSQVDATATGDAFCGGLAAALAEGQELFEALRWASAAGALAATKPGAVPSLPHRHEVEALLDENA
jgi:ribokinase